VATVLIKKYGNRRLYDTGDSRYITLDELATKVRTGVDVRVVDAQNGEDLTQATLVQVVLEAGNAAKFLPVQLLTQMIRLSDDSLAEFFSRYVTSALDLYLQAKRGVQSITAYNPLAQIPMAATDAIARMWMGSPFAQQYQQAPYGGGGYGPPSPYPSGPAPAPIEMSPSGNGDAHEVHAEPHGSKSDDVAAMRRELEELKQAVRESIASRPAKKPATKKKT
jgi:polyhydroxyalkanoate synthesis repressor PhaR